MDATRAETAARLDQERMTRELTSKWSVYVQRMYGVPADLWIERMAPSLALADATNLRNAMARDTFEGAMAELAGDGARLSDDKVVEMLAAGNDDDGTPQALGALSNDLVYTPVTPCRIVDTRNVAAGTIATNGTRNFVAIGVTGFTSQGGSGTDCGVNPLTATAVAVNITAVTPATAGFATVYPFGTTRPVASSINYTAGAIVNNALIVQIPNPVAAFDFTVYTFAQSHYVADIVGYFAPPVATELQCQNTADTTVTILSGSNANAIAPACAAGFTQTATNCEASSWLAPFVLIKNGVCSARNNDAVERTISASRTCCRVPGR
ncbi:hypothetical protein [Arenimonas alkanexedens]